MQDRTSVRSRFGGCRKTYCAYAAIAPAEDLLGRRVNPTVCTSVEFGARRTARDGFLMRVLREPHIVLVGSLDGE